MWGTVVLIIIVIALIVAGIIALIYFSNTGVLGAVNAVGDEITDMIEKNSECKETHGPRAFWDGGRKKCYVCPDGTNRAFGNFSAVEDPKACTGECANIYGDRIDDPKRLITDFGQGKCYECPAGTVPNVLSGTISPDLSCIADCSTFAKKGETSFMGLLDGKCYACPQGYSQDILAPNNSKSKCISLKPCGELNASEIKAGWKSFQFGPENKCYACPPGFNNSLVANERGVPFCVAPFTLSCDDINKGKGITQKLHGDLLSGTCGYCPAGYERTWASLDSDGACKSSKTCKELGGSNAFEDIWTGQCFTCPSGYTRGIARIDSDQACIKYEYNANDTVKIIPKNVIYKAASPTKDQRLKAAITSVNSPSKVNGRTIDATTLSKGVGMPATDYGKPDTQRKLLGPDHHKALELPEELNMEICPFVLTDINGRTIPENC